MTAPITLFLTRFGGPEAWAGGGRVLACQAAPPRFVRAVAAGNVRPLAPAASDLDMLRRTLQQFEDGQATVAQIEARMAWYRARYEAQLATVPDLLAAEVRDFRLVMAPRLRDLDTLICTCAAPWTERGGWRFRKHPCHLELLAPRLVAAGARVFLYGIELLPTGFASGLPFDLGALGWPPAADLSQRRSA